MPLAAVLLWSADGGAWHPHPLGPAPHALTGAAHPSPSRVTPHWGGSFRDSISALIERRDEAIGALSGRERSELQLLYESADAPLWLEIDGRPNSNLRDAVTILSHAADEGLEPASYDYERMAHLASGARIAVSAQDMARFDVAVSTCVLRYLRDLHVGRVDPRTLDARLDVSRQQPELTTLLRESLARQGIAALASELRPPLPEYERLRDLLSLYRALVADAPVVTPAADSIPIRPGDSFPGMGALQHLLMALQDLPADTPPPEGDARYEGPIVEGIRRFQRRHGLEPDGIVGRNTMAALSVPLTWRVRQIELAMERLRWLPPRRDERLILLNVPMFHLWAWNRPSSSSTPLFGMDVIVGQASRTQTPVFTADMREVIFRPYWTVPRSILRKEILPRIERDAVYLQREDMEIVRGDGDDAVRVGLSAETLQALRAGALRVRQRPGPKNALGLIKFAIPNPDDVYMHGTPAQALFSKSRRDFSHGCVRLSDPVALAAWALADRPEWTREKIVETMTGTQTVVVRLPHPIHVIVFYTTVMMAGDGSVHFAEDIYGDDARLDEALAGVHHMRTRPVSTWTKSDAG